MARSEAQKAADKKYRETHKGNMTTWTTAFKPSDAEEINATIAESGMTKAEFIRWAVRKWKEENAR